MRVVDAYPDETLSSWMERVALANGSRLVDWMNWLGIRGFTEAVDAYPSAALLQKLSDRCGMSKKIFRAMIVKPQNTALPSSLARAYCATCWNEDAEQGRALYARRAWMHTWSVHCRHHQEYLTTLFTHRDDFGWEGVWRIQRHWARAAGIPHRPPSNKISLHALKDQTNRRVLDDEQRWFACLFTIKPWLRVPGEQQGVRQVLRDLVLIAGLRFASDADSLARYVFPTANRIFYMPGRPGRRLEPVGPKDRADYEDFIASYSMRRDCIRVAGCMWHLLGQSDWRLMGTETVFQHLRSKDARLEAWCERRVRGWPKHFRDEWAELHPRISSPGYRSRPFYGVMGSRVLSRHSTPDRMSLYDD